MVYWQKMEICSLPGAEESRKPGIYLAHVPYAGRLGTNVPGLWRGRVGNDEGEERNCWVVDRDNCHDECDALRRGMASGWIFHCTRESAVRRKSLADIIGRHRMCALICFETNDL